MPIVWDKARKRFRYQLHRIIDGRRIRVNRPLPRSWTRAQADAYDDTRTGQIVAKIAGIERGSPSIDAAVMLYVAERVPDLKSGRSVEQDLAAIHGYYTGRTFADLPGIARQYTKDALARVNADGDPDPLKPATIRKRIALLRAACRFAWRVHGMGDADPGGRVVVPQVRNERQTYLDRAAVLAIVRRMALDSRGAAMIAFYSGMRLSEILRAEYVDGAFVLEDTKNGEPRIVPAHPRVAVYARRGIRCARAWIQRQFMRASRALGHEAHFHDLRHSAASQMINQDVDLYTVGAVLGHKSAQSTKRYAHLSQTKLREAVGKIGLRVLSPVAQKKRLNRKEKAV